MLVWLVILGCGGRPSKPVVAPVASAAPVACDSAELVGALRLHDQGGAPGTPESWRGWVIDATAVTCR